MSTSTYFTVQIFKNFQHNYEDMLFYGIGIIFLITYYSDYHNDDQKNPV